MFGKNGNDKTNISADIVLVLEKFVKLLPTYNSANGKIEVWRNYSPTPRSDLKVLMFFNLWR